MSLRNRSILFPSLMAAMCMLAVSCLADSQARIVRLSDIQGDVQIDRATGQGYERAFANFPVTQGVKLKTRADGRAEVGIRRWLDSTHGPAYRNRISRAFLARLRGQALDT